MELRHLKYFIAVAEEKSFSKAARRLNIAQPPLSYQINMLEEELNLKLFDRTVRPIELTLAGKYFYEKSLETIKSIQNYCKEAYKISIGEAGNLKISFTGNGIFGTIPQLIKDFRQKYPLIKLDLMQMNTHEQINRLMDNYIQIGMICAIPNMEEIQTKVIRREKFVLVLSKKHYLSKNSFPINLSDLKQDKFILTKKEAGEYYYNVLEKIFLEANLKPDIVQEVYELYTALALVRTGLGVSIVPESLKSFKLDGIVFKEIANVNEELITAVAWKKDSNNSLIKLFVDMF